MVRLSFNMVAVLHTQFKTEEFEIFTFVNVFMSPLYLHEKNNQVGSFVNSSISMP